MQNLHQKIRQLEAVIETKKILIRSQYVVIKHTLASPKYLFAALLGGGGIGFLLKKRGKKVFHNKQIESDKPLTLVEKIMDAVALITTLSPMVMKLINRFKLFEKKAPVSEP